MSAPALIPRPLVQQEAFMGVIWSGTAVGTIALAFRYYVRVKCFRRLLADDFIVGFAWILLLATAIVWQIIVSDLYEVMEVGSGMRMPSPSFIDNFIRYSRGQLSVLFIFYVGLWAIKLNFLVFFYKLGNQVSYYRIAWWCITIFTVCAGFACVGTIQYRCLAGSYTEIMMNCTSESAVRFQDITLKLNCAWDVLTDALIMALPISILWNIRMSLRRRLALAGVFALVIITMVISIVRVSVVTRAAASSSNTSKQVESTWLYTWHFVESFVSLLVACLASFRALFASKERSQDARKANANHYYEQEKVGQEVRLRALKARAKHFQDSLFDSLKSTDMPMSKGSTMKLSSVSESESELRTEHSRGSMQNIYRTDSYLVKEESIKAQDIPEVHHHQAIGDGRRM